MGNFKRLPETWQKEENNMLTIQEVLPFLVPLAVVELALLAYTIHHILTHNTYKRGSRGLWIAQEGELAGIS